MRIDKDGDVTTQGNLDATTLSVGGGTQISTLSEATHTTNWSGVWASAQAGNIDYSVIGNTVTLTIPEVNAISNSNAVIVTDTALPASIRPTENLHGWCYIITAGSFASGQYRVLTTGVVEIRTEAGGTITGTGGFSTGVYAFGVSYRV
jgi:hypothetical protein